MEISVLKNFLMWCTILNGGLLVLWSVFILLAPDLVYKTQSVFVDIKREKFDLVLYCFLGAFKIFYIVFNVVPFVALLIID